MRGAEAAARIAAWTVAAAGAGASVSLFSHPANPRCSLPISGRLGSLLLSPPPAPPPSATSAPLSRDRFLLQAASVLPAMTGAGGSTVPSAATTRDAALATGWHSTAALAVMVAVAAVPAMANGAVAGTTASAPIAAADAALAVLVTPAASATTATQLPKQQHHGRVRRPP